MSGGHYAKSDLAYTDSDYLCPLCHELLYLDASAGKDICFNAACLSYTHLGEITENVVDHEGPLRAEEQLRQSVRDFRSFSRKFLFTRLYRERTHWFSSYLKGGGLPGNIVAAIEYLMTRLACNASWGSSEDELEYRRKFDTYFQNFDIMRLVETISSKDYILTPAGQAFVVKYSRALEVFRRTIGVVSSTSMKSRGDLHSFSFIDEKAKGRPADHVFDFAKRYKRFAPNIVSLTHMFRAGHTVSRMHKYPSKSADFEALQSLWKKCRPNRLETITREKLRHIYDATLAKTQMHGDFDQFLADYASGEKYAPVLVFDGEKYRFDYPTLFLYMAYIYSNNRACSGIQTESGSATHGRTRQEASAHFEAEVRRVLRAAGFETHPRTDGEKFKPSFGGKCREFDCVAVDRDSKVIVLVEAKYRDIPPSSMTGSTLVDHLVLDRQSGLLGQANDHHARRQFFIRNFSHMGEFGLRLDESFLDYAIHTLLVTKHEPLISHHKSVRIVSYDVFKAIDFRVAGGEGRG